MPEPPDGELKEFVQYSLSKGIPREDIEEMLLASGWPKRVVEKLFSRRQTIKKISAASVLRVQGVTMSFGKHQILNNINLTIKPAEVFGIIGLSGSGKTTLLNALVGFIVPDVGDIVVTSPKDGKEYSIFKRPDIIKKSFGFATQTPSLYTQLTAEENLHHFASLYGISKRERIARASSLLKMVGILESKNVLAGNLSGGMQKRLDIACALIHRPMVLILDEPTADLDPIARDDMWNLVKEIHKEGTTVVIASHFLSEIEDFCTRIGILHEKRIVEVGTPTELKNVYSKNYEIVIETKDHQYDKLEQHTKHKKGIARVAKKGNQLILYTPHPEETLPAIARLIEKLELKLVTLKVNKPTLRELFEALVRK